MFVLQKETNSTFVEQVFIRSDPTNRINVFSKLCCYGNNVSIACPDGKRDILSKFPQQQHEYVKESPRKQLSMHLQWGSTSFGDTLHLSKIRNNIISDFRCTTTQVQTVMTSVGTITFSYVSSCIISNTERVLVLRWTSHLLDFYNFGEDPAVRTDGHKRVDWGFSQSLLQRRVVLTIRRKHEMISNK